MEKELFALLRLGLGTKTIEEESLSDFIVMSANQWAQIGELAHKHGVMGIVLDGVERLASCSYGATRELPVELKLEWISEVLQIEQANHHQKTVMNDLAEKWTQEGCRVMVFKGQANGTLYPRPEHRSPGDIDCYLFEDYAKGNEISRKVGADVDEGWYKHSQIHYKGEMFENHQYFVHTRDGKRGKRMEKELEDELKMYANFLPLTSYVLLPSLQWNAMFLTYHACAHFISEGLRLKQILDWAMFLKQHQNDVDWDAFYGFCERYHLRRFADAMTAIVVKYLNVNLEDNKINAESPYSEKILHSALYDDDYVFGSDEGNWHIRWYLIRNLWTYRWKYEEIYQMNIFKQLWYYAIGYLFKTE